MIRYFISLSVVTFFGACVSASEVRVWGTTNTVYYTTAEQAAMYTVPAGLTDVTQVAICDRSIAALRATGEVVVWGAAGQPTLTVPTLALSGVTQISASGIRSFHARRSDGTVVSWGSADGNTSTTPAGLTNVVKVHGGVLAAIAIKADGTVVGWGDLFVNPPVGFTCQDAFPNALALQANGSLSHWDSTPAKAALNIPAGLTATALFTNGSLIAGVVSASGTVTMWGPSAASHLNVPSGLTGIAQLAIGNDHVVARGTNGTLTMWGDGVTQQPEMGVPTGWNGCQAIAAGLRVTAAVFSSSPNGSAPIDITLSSLAVNYHAEANATIGSFSFSDLDPGDRQVYTLVAGAGSTDNGSFSISGSQLRVGASVLNAPENSTLYIRVRATDSGGLTYEKSFTLAVGAAPPAPEGSDSKSGIFGSCGLGSGMAVLIAALMVACRVVARVR